jgi:Tfp pilus assembly protein FimT
MKRTAFSNARGFSTLQLVITVAVMTIVAGFAVVGITRARDHVRLINSARQFAAYVERARGDSIRRHAGTANQSTVEVADNNTYSVTMDWDGFGNLSTRNFDLEQAIVFTPGMVGKSVRFDWRGRIANEESFGFDNGRNQVNVHVTGSGDVTFDTDRFFDRLIPTSPVTGTGGPVTPEPGASPLPPPPPGTDPTPTPTPDPNATPTPTPDPNATPTPTPDPNATPTPTQSPQPCTINGPNSITIVSNGSATVSVNRTNVTGMGTITATSNNSGQIQVTPSSRSVSGTAAGSFTITVKKNSGSVTFSSSGCTSKTVDITVP